MSRVSLSAGPVTKPRFSRAGLVFEIRNPTVWAGSTGALKRGTVVGRTDRRTKWICPSLRLENSVCQAERFVQPSSVSPLKCGTVRLSGPVLPRQLKRETVVGRTDRQTHCCNYIRDCRQVPPGAVNEHKHIVSKKSLQPGVDRAW